MSQANQRAKTTAAAPRQRRLHSIHLLLREQEFCGKIESGGKSYDCRYHPVKGEIVDGKLRLSGSFSAIGDGAASRTLDSVKATLAAMQAGYGTAPRPPSAFAENAPQTAARDLPSTENTAGQGYAGVLYFHLSPMDGRRLGLNADFQRVQLNLRLAPVSEDERELQWLLSAVAASLLSDVKETDSATRYLEEINKRLRA
jgi:hypothetical protein